MGNLTGKAYTFDHTSGYEDYSEGFPLSEFIRLMNVKVVEWQTVLKALEKDDKSDARREQLTCLLHESHFMLNEFINKGILFSSEEIKRPDDTTQPGVPTKRRTDRVSETSQEALVPSHSPGLHTQKPEFKSQSQLPTLEGLNVAYQRSTARVEINSPTQPKSSHLHSEPHRNKSPSKETNKHSCEKQLLPAEENISYNANSNESNELSERTEEKESLTQNEDDNEHTNTHSNSSDSEDGESDTIPASIPGNPEPPELPTVLTDAQIHNPRSTNVNDTTENKNENAASTDTTCGTASRCVEGNDEND